MSTIAQKWGNSLAVRIPKLIAQKAKVVSGTTINIEIDTQGNILLKLLDSGEKLKKYLDKITPENLHKEVLIKEDHNESWEY